jgi:hypothetical protein
MLGKSEVILLKDTKSFTDIRNDQDILNVSRNVPHLRKDGRHYEYSPNKLKRALL